MGMGLFYVTVFGIFFLGRRLVVFAVFFEGVLGKVAF
jgi:hypothetical protein